MYSAPYGYQNAAAGPIFNGAPPQQAAHMQPNPSPNQQQQMMYNSQQFPMPGQPGAFPTGPNPALMGGGAAGSAGMMQNPGMPHMAPNGQSKHSSLTIVSSIPAYRPTLGQSALFPSRSLSDIYDAPPRPLACHAFSDRPGVWGSCFTPFLLGRRALWLYFPRL